VAEIRIVVDRREPPPPPDVTRSGELVWELRRLLAWSGGTLADIADTLESRGGELDGKARGLLQDEVYAVEADLATVKALLSDPIDWDAEYGSLLAGELPPFDDSAVDEDDEDHP
jgi:hypothetical protein